MRLGGCIVFGLCFLGISGLGWFVGYCYRHPPAGILRESFGKKSWEKYLYPAAFYLHLIWRKRFLVPYPEEKVKRLQITQPGDTRGQVEEEYDCQRLSWILLLLFLVLFVTGFSLLGGEGKQLLTTVKYLTRTDPGGGDQRVQLALESGRFQKEFTVTIPERQYLPEELQAKLAEAKQYICRNYLGKNESAEKITKPLLLMSQIPDSQIVVKWKLDSNGYVNKDGTLNNHDLEEETEIVLTAVLTYGETKEKLPLELILYPREKSWQESFWDKWKQQWEEELEKTAQESYISLPDKVEGVRLSYRRVSHPVWYKLLLGGLAVCVLMPFLLNYQTEQRIRKRDNQLQQEYPEMVERFILLLSAGLTIRGVWYRITEDYERRRSSGEIPRHYLYEEMLLTRREMENGQSESMAYTAFGRRISLLPYMKFSTLLVQNLKKGSDDLLKRMDMEAVEALRSRREMAKRLGEEAGTRLLLPMLMLLVIVFGLILVAAFQTM